MPPKKTKVKGQQSIFGFLERGVVYFLRVNFLFCVSHERSTDSDSDQLVATTCFHIHEKHITSISFFIYLSNVATAVVFGLVVW